MLMILVITGYLLGAKMDCVSLLVGLVTSSLTVAMEMTRTRSSVGRKMNVTVLLVVQIPAFLIGMVHVTVTAWCYICNDPSFID